MPIETVCQTCGQRLRVADEHAGKAARCPACQPIYTVPPAASRSQPLVWPGPTPVSAAGSDRWHMRTPDGLTYGPVPKAELDQWLQQGRVTAQSLVLCEADGQWVSAAKLYPQLAAYAPSAPAPQPTTPINPYASPYADLAYGAPSQPYREQHRGPVILALGIVGIFFCDIISIIAVVMAISDLSKMSRGIMDPGGRGLTIAGLVLAVLKLSLAGLIFLGLALSKFF